MTLVFRLPAILLGAYAGYLAFSLFRVTKGGSNGWIYLSVKGLCLFFWAATALIFSMIDLPSLRYLTGAFFLFLIAVTVPITYVKLVEDFGAKRPRWLNVRNTLFFVIIVYLLFLFGNVFFGNFAEPLVTLLTVSHLTLGIAALVAIIPTYILVKETGQRPWKLALIFAILVGVGLNFGQYSNNCCSEEGDFYGMEICEGYDLDYTKIYNAPCFSGLVIAGQYYQIALLASIIVLPIALYQLNSRLRF